MLRKVRVENGLVEGLPASDPRITSFKGIPFAATPVGENRWRAPQPAKDWDGVFKAYKFGPISMQHVPGEDPDNIYSLEWNVEPEIEMSEDSLRLNIWTPACSADEKLPVLIWFYGGGMLEGNTAEMELDGERLARRGIIVVTVGYRLNCFGLMCHPEITKESPESPCNFGYLDQRFAVLWVMRNIASFGGDPDSITLGGQGSGGGNVMTHITSPLNSGLFRRAVIASGVELMPYPPRTLSRPVALSEAEAVGVKFFDILGVETLAEARALDAFYIRDKMTESGLRFTAVADGSFITGQSNELFIENKCDMIPMMFGHTREEFFMTPPAANIAEFEDFARKIYGDDADEFLELCRSERGSFPEMMAKSRIMHMEYSLRIFGRKRAGHCDKLPFYYWVFDPEIPGWDDPGTFHSSDLWFFFETLAKCWRPFVGKHYDLARMMCNYLANFVKTGDPNGKDADGTDMPHWEPFTDEKPVRMVLGDKPYTESKKPDELMEFLIRHAAK